MVDWDKPIRRVSDKRQLWPGWTDERQLWLDTRPDGAWKSGVPYNRDGTPVDEEHPWGPVENFTPASPFLEIVDVGTPAEQLARRREHAELKEQLGDSDLWGAF